MIKAGFLKLESGNWLNIEHINFISANIDKNSRKYEVNAYLGVNPDYETYTVKTCKTMAEAQQIMEVTMDELEGAVISNRKFTVRIEEAGVKIEESEAEIIEEVKEISIEQAAEESNIEISGDENGC